MSGSQKSMLRTALGALYRSRGHRLLAPLTKGLGAVLMLHRVLPGPKRPFDPNAGLRVTPEFLARAITLVRQEGYETVSLDEAHRRLLSPTTSRPFVAFTLDDGYRDTLEHAYPVFKHHNVPFCIYVPTAYADGRADLWWVKLESAITAGRPLRLNLGRREWTFDCATPTAQQRTWDRLYWWMRGLDEDTMRAMVQSLCHQAGYDATALAGDTMMTWAEVSRLAADPLCTIGAHTVNHYSMAKLPEARARDEMLRSRQGLEDRLAVPVRHFSYPYGSAADAGPREFDMAAEAGFATAVTTRKGLLFPEHRHHMTALPRLSLNGEVQDERLLAVLLGGTPFALINGFRHVSVA